MSDLVTFRPKARLILQLGNELIRNESIALLELIKNAYDADACNVQLKMNKIDDMENGEILILDDGSGMDLKIIKNVWMEPGSDYKVDKKRRKTEKFGRTVLGEKGIGRFAAHKLGDYIELVSRKNNHKEVVLEIDWSIFKNSTYLDEVPITIKERIPKVFEKNKHGTQITIKRLREPWNRELLRTVYRAYNSLRSPYETPSAFKIDFDTDKDDWLEGLLSWKDVKKFALFDFSCDLEGDKITKFTYEFNPWNSMDKLIPNKVTEKDNFGKVLQMKDKSNEPIDLSKHKIGKIHFEGKIFDLDPKILTLGMQSFESISDKEGLKEYLNLNGGIKVFRDGVRVYDYGEPGNDWLDLDIRRVNMPTKRISNNLIMGSVSLKRATSEDLTEKTNREGFLENDAYFTFTKAVLYALECVEHLRKIDKEEIRKLYGPTRKSEPVISRISEVRTVISEKIEDKELKKDLKYHLDQIEEDYKTIHQNLLKSAGAGLSLSVAVHEMDKVIEELLKVVESDKSSVRVTSLVKHLRKLVEGYSVAIRKSSKRDWSVRQLVDQALFNFEFRFTAHKISTEFPESKKLDKIKIKCARSLIVSSIMNILDNSIWWLAYGEIKTKKIFLNVYTDNPKNISLVIADNGPGFSLPTETLTEPSISAKPDGMGLGLHIANEIMKVHKGRLVFPEWGEYEIPKEYKNGAIVALVFPRE